MGGVRRRQIISYKDHGFVGQTGLALFSSGEQTQDALSDVVQIRSSLCEAVVLDLLQLDRAALDRLLPRPCRAVSGVNLCADFQEDLRIVQ